MVPSFGHVLVTAVLAQVALVSALPPKVRSDLINGNGRASIRQEPGDVVDFHGPEAIYNAFIKYGVEPPEHVKQATALVRRTNTKRITGSTPASPQDPWDTAQRVYVNVGTPPRRFATQFDTGSADFWLVSTAMPKNETVQYELLYDPKLSSTANLMEGYSWRVQYVSGGFALGNVYSETVNIAGITMPNYPLEAVVDESPSFSTVSAAKGLIGMGFQIKNRVLPVQQPTFFDAIVDKLDLPVFTADMKHAYLQGSYNFGYIDNRLYNGSIIYSPIDSSQGYWNWTCLGYAIGDDTSLKSVDIAGVVDTGTSILLLPAAVVSEYWSRVPGSENSASLGGWVYPCGTPLPSFSIGIGGGANITIPPAYMKDGPFPDGVTCFGSLQESTGLPFSLFGLTAIKSAFVVYNRSDPPTIGWASKDLNGLTLNYP
ncbi:microbial aspartic proteinase [Thozetella sp. PMI_491]|nr:microbial aspartic proteinase [Thozetella sp. PMI_491]